MLIEVSNGEIADKLTIIEIKLEKISDPEKRKNLQAEWEVLNAATTSIMDKSHPLYKKLFALNSKLWDIEDDCRAFEKKQDLQIERLHKVSSPLAEALSVHPRNW